MRQGSLLVLVFAICVSACNLNETDLGKSLPTDLDEGSSEPMAGMGVMVGELTPQGALVQVRLTQSDTLVDGDVPGISGTVEFQLFAGESEVDVQTIEAVAEHDFIARAAFSDLQPATEYVCKTRIGKDAQSLHAGPEASFRTLAGIDIAREAKFVVVTGMNYAKFHGDNRIDKAQDPPASRTTPPCRMPYAGPDKASRLSGARDRSWSRSPHFFVGTGDNVYYDTPEESARGDRSIEMRQKWHEQWVQPRYSRSLCRSPHLLG